jgi:hypothetical protein
MCSPKEMTDMTGNDPARSTPPEQGAGPPAWDIGAPPNDRGADLADEQGSPLDQASHGDTRS